MNVIKFFFRNTENGSLIKAIIGGTILTLPRKDEIVFIAAESKLPRIVEPTKKYRVDTIHHNISHIETENYIDIYLKELVS